MEYAYIEERNVGDVGKKFKCDLCSKGINITILTICNVIHWIFILGFGTKDSVKLHLFAHLGLKPFKCKVGFHLTLFFTINDLNLFIQICSKGLRSKAQLRKHLRTHDKDDYNCRTAVEHDEEGRVFCKKEVFETVHGQDHTICKQEVDIDAKGLIQFVDLKPS